MSGRAIPGTVKRLKAWGLTVDLVDGEYGIWGIRKGDVAIAQYFEKADVLEIIMKRLTPKVANDVLLGVIGAATDEFPSKQ